MILSHLTCSGTKTGGFRAFKSRRCGLKTNRKELTFKNKFNAVNRLVFVSNGDSDTGKGFEATICASNCRR